MAEMQLDFAGREVSIPASMASWQPTHAQRAVLGLAKRPEGVTALRAGVALHALRKAFGTGGCGYGAKYDEFLPVKRRSKACCLYASSDGSACLKRLVARGVVEQRKPRGPYFAVIK
jgi:hypothetical protein